MTTPTVSAECEKMLAAVSAYLDGDLDASACEAIEQHCQRCEPCAVLVTGLRESVGLCHQAGAAPLPDAVRERAQASVRRLLESAAAPRVPCRAR